MLAVALAVIGGVLGRAIPIASAALEYRNDEQGPNDEVGQSDLTRVGVDSSGLPASMQVGWSWDTIALSGANTADACALFDTDSDGRVNLSLCVTVGGNPAAQTPASPRLYGCGDDSVDRCTSPAPVTSVSFSCSVAQTATDPFPEVSRTRRTRPLPARLQSPLWEPATRDSRTCAPTLRRCRTRIRGIASWYLATASS